MKKSMSSFMDAALTRAEMKELTGGTGIFCKTGACNHFIQGKDGHYAERTGTCETQIYPILDCYCDTGMGNVEVTSNNNQSRCHN